MYNGSKKMRLRYYLCKGHSMSNEPKNGKVNPPSQIFLKFHKQIELFMLIPKN